MNRRLPPFNQLVAFEAAARWGSFSRAAQELNLSQSAVSQQLIKLEAALGQQLFFRRGTGVVLTAAGEVLVQTVGETLTRLSSGLARIEPYKNRDSVLIACPPDFAHGWLVPRLDQLKLQHPKLEVWLITGREVREIDRIDVDLVVSRRPIHTADVECAPLLEDASVAVVGARTAQRIARLPFPRVLEAAPVLLLETEPAWGDRLLDPALKGRRIVRGATIDDARLLLDAVQRELGIGLVSQVLAAQALQEGKVVALSQVAPTSLPRLWLMRTRLAPRTPLADQAYQWLRQAAQAGV